MTDARNTRTRRIARRSMLLAALLLMLPVWYVGVWLMLSIAVQNGTINAARGATFAPVFRPIYWYCVYDLPAARGIRKLWWTSVPPPIPPNRTYIILYAQSLAPPHPDGAPNDRFR